MNDPNGGIQAVKDGKLTATILYPTGGSEAIKLAIKLANKEIVSKNNNLFAFFNFLPKKGSSKCKRFSIKRL